MANTYAKVLYYGNQSSYDLISSPDSNKLYFCVDTGKLYKGDVDFSKYCEAVSSRPNSPTRDRLYLISGTGTAEFYDGTNWNVVSPKMVNSFDGETASSSEVATTSAIVNYVLSVIGGSSDVVKLLKIKQNATAGVVTYTTADDVDHDITVPLVVKTLAADANDAATIDVALTTGSHAAVVVPKVVTGIAAKTGSGSDAKVAVTLSSGSHADVTIPGVLTAGGFSWNGTTRVLTLTDSNGTQHEANIGKDIFIDETADNRYENGNIYLYLNDGTGSSDPTEIVIPVTGLITDYVGYDTDSISMNVDSTTHHVTAEAILKPDIVGASPWTNALKLSSTVGAKGLYVDLTDVETDLENIASAIQWGTF